MIKVIRKLFNKEKRELFNKEKSIDIYFGNLKVTTIPEKAIKVTRGENRERRELFSFVAWDKKHNGYVEFENIKLENIPYIDHETSNTIYFNRNTGQVESVLYIVDGLSSHKIKLESPSTIEVSNGIIVAEIYRTFFLADNLKDEYSTRNGKHTIELNSYTIPKKITYQEDGSIDEIESFWEVNINQKETKRITFQEYKEILKPLHINLYDFKKHTKLERTLIHMYMNINLYKKELYEMGVGITQKSFLDNLEAIKMYYY